MAVVLSAVRASSSVGHGISGDDDTTVSNVILDNSKCASSPDTKLS